MRSLLWIVSVAAVVALSAAAAMAEDTMLHYGTVVAIDRQSGTLAIDEVSRSGVGKPAATVTRLTMHVSPHTMFVAARRADGGSRSDGFSETLLPDWTVKFGDFVAVLCQHDGPFLSALEIVVTAPDDHELP